MMPFSQKALGKNDGNLFFLFSLMVMVPYPPRLEVVLVNKDDQSGSYHFCVEDEFQTVL